MASVDTIVAVATAAGSGGIGIIRVSGGDAARIATILLGKRPRPRHAHYATFRDANGDAIDHGLLLHFPAPRSFTGEDIVELQVHGAPVVLRRLRQRVVQLGARLARPGEFSERAFLNGKLDLVQAEAIADLIASGSETAARAALRSLDGEFSRRVDALREALVRQRVWIEAAIDFPEEDIDFIADPRLVEAFDALKRQLADLLAAAKRGQRLGDGLHVVIAGPPNAGKSSLLNALAATDRAIVTDIAGTTRDLLRETIDLDGIAMTLVDTAGLREAGDVVEVEGIRRAREELKRADVVIVVDGGSPPGELDEIAVRIPDAVTTLRVHNKIDRDGEAARRVVIDGNEHFWLSAKTGEGLTALVDALKRLASGGEDIEGAFTARARHVAALQRAQHHLDTAATTLARGGELAAEELRHAHDALAEITGAFGSEDLLGEIFSSFCIGK